MIPTLASEERTRGVTCNTAMSVIPASWVRIRATPDGAKQEVRPEGAPGCVLRVLQSQMWPVASQMTFTLFACHLCRGTIMPTVPRCCEA